MRVSRKYAVTRGFQDESTETIVAISIENTQPWLKTKLPYHNIRDSVADQHLSSLAVLFNAGRSITFIDYRAVCHGHTLWEEEKRTQRERSRRSGRQLSLPVPSRLQSRSAPCEIELFPLSWQFCSDRPPSAESCLCSVTAVLCRDAFLLG